MWFFTFIRFLFLTGRCMFFLSFLFESIRVICLGFWWYLCEVPHDQVIVFLVFIHLQKSQFWYMYKSCQVRYCHVALFRIVGLRIWFGPASARTFVDRVTRFTDTKYLHALKFTLVLTLTRYESLSWRKIFIYTHRCFSFFRLHIIASDPRSLLSVANHCLRSHIVASARETAIRVALR